MSAVSPLSTLERLCAEAQAWVEKCQMPWKDSRHMFQVSLAYVIGDVDELPSVPAAEAFQNAADPVTVAALVRVVQAATARDAAWVAWERLNSTADVLPVNDAVKAAEDEYYSALSVFAAGREVTP